MIRNRITEHNLLTTSEAARLVGCSPRTIARWCDCGMPHLLRGQPRGLSSTPTRLVDRVVLAMWVGRMNWMGDSGQNKGAAFTVDGSGEESDVTL